MSYTVRVININTLIFREDLIFQTQINFLRLEMFFLYLKKMALCFTPSLVEQDILRNNS